MYDAQNTKPKLMIHNKFPQRNLLSPVSFSRGVGAETGLVGVSGQPTFLETLVCIKGGVPDCAWAGYA